MNFTPFINIGGLWAAWIARASMTHAGKSMPPWRQQIMQKSSGIIFEGSNISIISLKGYLVYELWKVHHARNMVVINWATKTGKIARLQPSIRTKHACVKVSMSFLACFGSPLEGFNLRCSTRQPSPPASYIMGHFRSQSAWSNCTLSWSKLTAEDLLSLLQGVQPCSYYRLRQLLESHTSSTSSKLQLTWSRVAKNGQLDAQLVL